MKKKKISLNKLFYNNRFVLFFSIILSVVIWLIVALQFSPEVDQVIKDVPVKIELSNSVETFDLQIFGTSDFKVDVTVTGKRYVVSPTVLSADDFTVTANTNYVDSAGKYSLKIDAKSKVQSAEYKISKVSTEYIEVFFDTYKEGEYTLIPETLSVSEVVPEGYFKDDEVLSAKTVTVSGPSTEMNKISKVFAKVMLEKAISSTKTQQAEVVPLGEYGNVLRYLTINNGNADITVTIPVYKLSELPVTISFTNVPAYFIDNPLPYTVNPKNAVFGIEEAALESMTGVIAGSVDFSDLKSGINEISIKTEDIKLFKVMDETKLFKVSIDASQYSERQLSVPLSNIKIVYDNQEKSVSLKSKGISKVTVVGPKSIIENLLPQNIFAEADLNSEVLENGTFNFYAKLSVMDHDDCWVYGRYSVEVNVADKQ